jgi:hypothetical protein
MKTRITFEIDTDTLADLDDGYLAQLWHIAQANPAPHGDRDAGELVDRLSTLIISRWLAGTAPELYYHQADDYAMKLLRQHGKWVDGVWTPAEPGGPPDAPDDEPWERNDAAVQCALLLVDGPEVPIETIKAWSDAECRQAQEWALATHVRASDNDDVVVPPLPACVAALSVAREATHG